MLSHGQGCGVSMLTHGRLQADRAAKRAWFLSQTAQEIAKYDEEEQVRWILHHAPKGVAEAMVRRLLKVTAGDAGRALGLCGAAAGVAPAGKLPLKNS